MAHVLSVIGYIGTGVVICAYVPQIWHLWTERCSAGISERAYAMWVLASALFLGHSIVIGDVTFMATQLVNIVALTIIVVLARRFRNQVCAEHARQLHVRERLRVDGGPVPVVSANRAAAMQALLNGAPSHPRDSPKS